MDSKNSFYTWKRQAVIGLKFIQRFGILTGLRLFICVRLGKIDNLSIPGVQHPISLRRGTSDIRAFCQIFLYGCYDFPVEKTPRVIVDGGANVGLFTVLMKNRYPDAKIICIEPDPDNFAQLQKNVAPYSGVYPENCGIWNKDTRLSIHDKFNMGKWGMVVEENPTGGSIKAISIGSLVKKHQLESIDILKLDIETSEKKVFEHNFESWLSKTGKVIIELHDWMEPGCSQRFFSAVAKAIPNYLFFIKGENVIIEAT
ncbi:MAG: FkbM family methyltransferase [Flavihumibacter sp.]